MSDKFEEWLDKSFEGEYLMRSRRLLVKEAWDHQQQKIDKLKEENQVLRDSYNSLVSDMTNGEHIDFSWVRSAIDSAAVDMIALALQKKLYGVENRNLKLENLLKEDNKVSFLMDKHRNAFERWKDSQMLLKESCEKLDFIYQRYIVAKNFKSEKVNTFLNKPEIIKVRGEEV